ncbi:DUF6452 family protein [Winogradskyella sp.]|uniref:DUF6452 family protein n=1 Tax=Winogradskyella sp. TaxID=1883156 RepID=UPI0025F644BF|nr:DUF6452 family protein [Winogradskyella sp.]
MRVLKLFALFIALTLISCERDDICAATTATTPRLLIEFYDISNPDDLKSVLRLTAYGEGLVVDDTGMIIEPIEASDSTILFNENASSLELPLRIDTEGETTTSRFILEKDTNLRLDSDTTTDSDIDIIEISYIPEFVFVSRACGYKSTFNNLDINIEPGTEAWISNIDIVETTIENENTVHVRIFH